MESIAALENRVRALETSLRRSRLLALMLGLTMFGVAGAALVPQAQEQVMTRRLVLTSGLTDSSAVVLIAGPQSSLVIQTPAGAEILRLGGPAARRILP